jgi:hypothetical protein
MGRCDARHGGALAIGSEAENTSGERGDGQAETARVVRHSSARLNSIIAPIEEMSLQ